MTAPGNCAHTPKNVFFPQAGHKGGNYDRYRAAVAQAKAICEGCPQQLRCYQQAVAANEQQGIWGGVNFAERHNRRNTTTNTEVEVCGTEAGWSRHARKAKQTGEIITCQPCLDARKAATTIRNRTYTQQRRKAGR